MLDHADSKAFVGTGAVKDGKAADLTAVQERASEVDDDRFEEEVRGVLERGIRGRDKKNAAAAGRLLQLFDKKWGQSESAPAPAPKKAAVAKKGGSSKAAAAAAAKEAREFGDKEKRALVERLAGLTAKSLVEALHVAKSAQPDLDVGLDPEKIVLSLDDMSQECLAGLIAFCENK